MARLINGTWGITSERATGTARSSYREGVYIPGALGLFKRGKKKTAWKFSEDGRKIG